MLCSGSAKTVFARMYHGQYMKFFSLCFFLLFFTSCNELDLGASVDSMVITPNQISLSETGMTDEIFNIEIQVSAFDGEIDKSSVRIYREKQRVEAVPETISVNGNRIKLSRIAKSWFGDVVEAGSFSIGAEMSSDSQFINEQDLATITVIP